MGLAVAEVGEPAARPADAHRHVGDADRVPQLVVGAAGREHREGVDEGDLAGERQAGGGGGHVLLGDAHLEVAFRELAFMRIERVDFPRSASSATTSGFRRARASRACPQASRRFCW